MNQVDIKQVDAFTRIPFGGNPAGVVTQADGLADEWKQKIAREMNLSETAFVSESQVADYKVQFFTPMAEVDLCGHATIATFFALAEEGKLPKGKDIFHQETKAGVLPVELLEKNGESIFLMTQAAPKFEERADIRAELALGLGLAESDLMETMPAKVYTGLWWLVIGIRKLSALSNASPDQERIRRLSEQLQVAGVIPFSLETENAECQFHLRSFCPAVGVPEDPVCGTGSGCAAAYIAHNQLLKVSSAAWWQGEAGLEVKRPGRVWAYVASDSQGRVNQVKVGGTARTVLEGKIMYE